MIDDNHAPVGQRLDRMARIGRDDSDNPRPCDLDGAVDRELQFAVDDLVDLLLRMEVLVDRGALVELVVGEGHGLGMEVAAAPTGQALHDRKRVRVDKGHGRPPQVLSVKPPSTTSSWPVMKSASSEASSRAPRAMSIGWPSRRSAAFFSHTARISGLSKLVRVMPV